jgi:hypothetical protein
MARADHAAAARRGRRRLVIMTKTLRRLAQSGDIGCRGYIAGDWSSPATLSRDLLSRRQCRAPAARSLWMAGHERLASRLKHLARRS